MSGPREAKFWSCRDDDEVLTHDDISEAVEEWADDAHPDRIPETITVYGFAPMELPPATDIANRALGEIIEWLDEELADPSGNGSQSSDELTAAALAFAEAIRTHYEPWMCEEVERRVISVRDYLSPDSPSYPFIGSGSVSPSENRNNG